MFIMKCLVTGSLGRIFIFFVSVCLVSLKSSMGFSGISLKNPSFNRSLLRDKIGRLVRASKISSSKLSIIVGEGTPLEEVIFSLNPRMKLIPASVTKLATSAMILEQIEPGTKFKTGLWSDGKIKGDHLKGSLYLKGGGDPSFVSENMWFLVNHFLRSQIKTIEGDIVVDDSLFDEKRFDSSRQDVRVDRAYDAPTGAMSFNWNSVNIFVRPGPDKGASALVISDPENSYIELKSSVLTGPPGSSKALDVERKAKDNGDIILVKGTIPVDSKEVVIYKNITHPDLWSGHNLVSFLKQRGIQVLGTVRRGGTPSEAQLLAESESKSIEDILSDMNKFSNNYVAEMLAKGAASRVAIPGTISKSMELLYLYMEKLGLNKGDFEIKNPSGLTRENRLSAYALWKVLLDIKNRFDVFPEFATSLPIAGIDGTLKKRFKNSSGERMVRAKTGFLTGVVSLAGYLSGPKGTWIPFVMIYNGSDDESKVRELFDKICLSAL